VLSEHFWNEGGARAPAGPSVAPPVPVRPLRRSKAKGLFLKCIGTRACLTSQNSVMLVMLPCKASVGC
jgi:hypothetical protein